MQEHGLEGEAENLLFFIYLLRIKWNKVQKKSPSLFPLHNTNTQIMRHAAIPRYENNVTTM